MSHGDKLFDFCLDGQKMTIEIPNRCWLIMSTITHVILCSKWAKTATCWGTQTGDSRTNSHLLLGTQSEIFKDKQILSLDFTSADMLVWCYRKHVDDITRRIFTWGIMPQKRQNCLLVNYDFGNYFHPDQIVLGMWNLMENNMCNVTSCENMI